MKIFIVLSVLAYAAAKPQYSYQQPAPQYAAPVQQYAAPVQQYAAPAPQPQFFSAQQFSQQPQDISKSGLISLVGGLNQGGFAGGQAFSSFQSGPAPGPVSQTLVQKHIYVHVPPPSQEDEYVPQAPVINHQKHYKIVFIKAPSAPAVHPAVYTQQNTQEEKTLVYVLVKKPESLEDLHIPAPAPQPISKPEVYFIKYKTHKEQGHAVGPAPGPGASVEVSDQVQQPSPVYGPAH